MPFDTLCLQTSQPKHRTRSSFSDVKNRIERLNCPKFFEKIRRCSKTNVTIYIFTCVSFVISNLPIVHKLYIFTARQNFCSKTIYKIHLKSNVLKMKKIVCFVPGFESFGIFIGCLLADRDEPNKIRKTTEFYNLVSDELSKFLEIYDYNRQNMEKFFGR